MENEREEGKIEKLQRDLYSRKGVERDAHDLDLNRHNVSVEEKWKEDEEVEIEVPEEPKKGLSMLGRILIISIIFFILSLAFSTYIFFKGNNTISPSKIEIVPIGPTLSGAGEEMSLDLNITNKNDTPIELADLLIEYPKGTRNPQDRNSELPRERIEVGRIEPNETVRKTVKAVIFGEEGNKKDISFNLEYRIPNSSSVFNKEGTYTLEIGSSPITIKVESLKEINSNQSLDTTVSIVSNSKEVLKNILVTADFPFGFELEKATPDPVKGKNVWRIGDIEPEGKRTIKIRGKVIGEDDQNRVFKWKVGAENPKQENSIDVAISTIDQLLSIKKPFLGATIIIDRSESGDFIATNGNTLNAEIHYQNNLSVPVTDVTIETKINGNLVDRRSISTNSGFYKSNEDKISWTKFEKEDLASLSPGDNGNINFSFSLLKNPSTNLSNPKVDIDVTVKAKRLSESDVPEEIVSTVSRKVLVASNAVLSGRSVHGTGSIENMGEIPPRVDKKTEYGIIWTVTNDFNEIDGAKVTAILPSYVVWTGVSTPTSEKITYNSDSREITWDLGKVTAGAGKNLPFRQVAFQVSITPSLGQLGDVPNLVGVATLNARDTFTNTNLKSSIKEANTMLSTDPNFKFGDDRVIE